jgi:hypothetical protein
LFNIKLWITTIPCYLIAHNMQIVKSNVPGGPAFLSKGAILSKYVLREIIMPSGAEEEEDSRKTTLQVPTKSNLGPDAETKSTLSVYAEVELRCFIRIVDYMFQSLSRSIFLLMRQYLADVRAEVHKAIICRLEANKLSLAMIPAITRQYCNVWHFVDKEISRLTTKASAIHAKILNTSENVMPSTDMGHLLDVFANDVANLRNEMRSSIPVMLGNLQLPTIISAVLVDPPAITQPTVYLEANLNRTGQQLMVQLDSRLIHIYTMLKFESALYKQHHPVEASSLFLQTAMTANILHMQSGMTEPVQNQTQKEKKKKRKQKKKKKNNR